MANGNYASNGSKNGPGDKKKINVVKTKKGSKGPGMGDLKGHDQLHEKGLRAEKHAYRKGYTRQEAKKINEMVYSGKKTPNQAERAIFNKNYKK